MERYLISKVPALHMLLQWAEREEGVITDDLLAAAVGDGLTEWDRDGACRDYTQQLNCFLLGFLWNCLSTASSIIRRGLQFVLLAWDATAGAIAGARLAG